MQPTEQFLIRTAELLHQHGTPSYRFERVMNKVSKTLGVDGAYLYTPTSLIVSFGRGESERVLMRRIEAPAVDIGKLISFDAILERLERGSIDISTATIELETASSAPPIFNQLTTTIASGLACAAVAVLFGGGGIEVLVAGLLGMLINLASLFLSRRGDGAGILEPLIGFSVALSTLLIARHYVPMDDRLVTLAALILPLPGLSLTIALTELALGHLSSGSARLAGASVTLLTLVLGVGIAWRIAPDGMHAAGIEPFRVHDPLGGWATWVSLMIAPAAFGVLFKVPISQWPIIFVVAIGGFLISSSVGSAVSAETGSFCGALFVGCAGNLYARLRNRPAMTAQTPGLLILVPGSIGYRSLTAMLESQTLEGIALAFSMILIAGSLVGGLLTANLILPPKRIL